MFRLILLGGLLHCMSVAWADQVASFLCARAKGWVETTICSDGDLARLDIELAEVHARMLRSPDIQTRGRYEAEQQSWRKTRRQCQTHSDSNACLRNLYSERIANIRAAPAYPGDTPAIALKVTSGPGLEARIPRWVKELPRYMRAIDACRTATGPEGIVVHKLWVTHQGASINMWLETNPRQRRHCETAREGESEVKTRALTADEQASVTEVVLWVKPRKPPGSCSTIELLAPDGALYGWVTAAKCAS